MYTRDNFRLAKEELDRRRREAEALADARNEELRSISPQINEIDKELTGTGLLLFKTAIGGGDIEPIKKRNVALMEKRRALLASLGKPADYTELHYTCEECKDTGYVDNRMCKCLKTLLVTMNIESSGMGRLIEKQSFENFDIERYGKGQEGAMMRANLSIAKQFSQSFGTHKDNLLLMGTTGTGKTHLSSSIAREVISRGFDVLYNSAQNIISDFEYDQFRRGYGQNEPQGQKYLECELLIIDDLGAEFVNQFTIATLYNLINTRYNKGLCTVISTNLSATELSDKYEGRIYSRIIGAGYKLLYFKGKDARVGI